MSDTYRWTCPACIRNFQIEKGHDAPDLCADCRRDLGVVDEVAGIGESHEYIGNPSIEDPSLEVGIPPGVSEYRERRSTTREPRFILLRLIASIFIVLGVIAVFSGVVVGGVGLFVSPGLGLLVIVNGLVGGALFIAFAEVIQLLLTIEENTRKAAER